jgi:hypothetical protein
MSSAPHLDHEIENLEKRLPKPAARLVRWLRDPSNRWLRIPVSTVLIGAGLVGFLPILGFWMIPLGLALISYDVPFLRTPMIKLIAFINKKLEAKR